MRIFVGERVHNACNPPTRGTHAPTHTRTACRQSNPTGKHAPQRIMIIGEVAMRSAPDRGGGTPRPQMDWIVDRIWR